MKFGVHNHYNNNGDGLGKYQIPKELGRLFLAEPDVRITDQGITIFNLHKDWDIDEKLKLAEGLDRGLKEAFGEGLSFATCSSSDGINDWELRPFYDGMRAIDPTIKTIYITSKMPNGEWVCLPDDLRVEYLIDEEDYRETPQKVLSIVQPTEADRKKPNGGWGPYQEGLQRIFRGVVKSVEESRHPSVSSTQTTHAHRFDR